MSTILMLAVVIGIMVYVYRTSDRFHLTCVISNVDGNTYCVRDEGKLANSATFRAKPSTTSRTRRSPKPTYLHRRSCTSLSR